MAEQDPPLTAKARAAAEAVEALGRYRPLVADWDAFVAATQRGAPACLVANAARLDPAQLQDVLAADGRSVEPVPWTPGAFRCRAGDRPGLWWPFQAGLYQVQEEASLLPVHLLDPHPGERVLDLCAAPGGKAAQIAMALGGRGTVLANDKDSKRLAAVRDKMKRLGLLNLTTTVHDGGDFPRAAGAFDRVLVDAPCTAEGTNADAGAAYLRSTPRFRRWLAAQQRALLRRAARLVRPGGRIVYSTCSFAPEENEAVVDAVLRECGDALRVVPAPPLPDLAAAPGLDAWNGETFHPDLRHAVRLWPHLSGTGGFFAVALERRGAVGPDDAPARDAEAAGDAELGARIDPADMLAALARRFGWPDETFDGLIFRRRGHHIPVAADDHAPPAHPRPVSTGVPFTRLANRWPKPTTAAALLFGGRARRNVVALDAAQTEAYQTRRPVTPAPDQLAGCDGKGYVIVAHRGVALGVGLLQSGPPPRIDSQFPRAWVPHGRR